MVVALGGSPDPLRIDLEWLGALFQSLVIRDLLELGLDGLQGGDGFFDA